jgi:hypothetical protein
MDPTFDNMSRVAAIGIGATALMDAWLMLLRRFGIKTLNFAMVGRWVGHWRRGVFVHGSIANAPAVRGETALGWLFHYATGIGIAALLFSIEGSMWLRNPTFFPALAVGVGTIAAPWLVMQPAMGAGIASARTASPYKDRVRSIANHAVFGVGLYLAGLFLARFSFTPIPLAQP